MNDSENKLNKVYESGLTFSLTVYRDGVVSAQLNISQGYPKTFDSLSEAIDFLFEEVTKHERRKK